MDKLDTDRVRILGREIGEVLTDEEMNLISGGPFEGTSAHTDSHMGTCTNESDCD